MTLRTRLVVAVVVLTGAGLAVLGIVTYSLSARSQYDRRDDALRAAVNPVAARLQRAAGGGFGRPDDGSGPGGRGGFGPGLPGESIGAYGVLYDDSGTALASLEPADTDARPRVPRFAELHLDHIETVGSRVGSSDWRLLATRVGPDDHTVVVALALDDVDAALARLLAVEIGGALVLLVVLVAGVWLVLRHGLRPLEVMADDAARIADGSFDLRVAPADDGSEIGVLGGALNGMLDEIEAAFAARARDEQRLRAFVADAAHELRTPLTSIRGFAELFRLDSRPDGVDLDVILRRIESESLRMQALVDDLLALARLDDHQPRVDTDVDLAVLLRDAAKDLVAVEPTRSVSVEVDDAVVVRADEAQLRQVFANLLGNVVRHTPAGTPVECSARRDGEAVVVRVRDHGPGIDPDDRTRVFDRFWQADPSRAGSGTGLGLAIVAAIVREHGGTIAVDTPADGGAGACFTVRIPFGDSPETPSNP